MDNKETTLMMEKESAKREIYKRLWDMTKYLFGPRQRFMDAGGGKMVPAVGGADKFVVPRLSGAAALAKGVPPTPNVGGKLQLTTNPDKIIQQLAQKGKTVKAPGTVGRIGKHPLTLAGVPTAGVMGYNSMSESATDTSQIPELDPVSFVPEEERVHAEAGINPVHVAAGAAGGGGLSHLYGKLMDKPDLQRDLIAAALGAGAGVAYSVGSSKEASLEKEAVNPILLTLLGTGTFLGGDYAINKGNRKSIQAAQEQMAADTQRTADYFDQMNARRAASDAKLDEATKALQDTKAGLKGGAAGATVGGAGGAALSRVYGKVKNDPSLKRDLLMTASGALVGGLTGAHLATS